MYTVIRGMSSVVLIKTGAEAFGDATEELSPLSQLPKPRTAPAASAAPAASVTYWSLNRFQVPALWC